jgi:tellurite resistance protein TehA-like permease
VLSTLLAGNLGNEYRLALHFLALSLWLWGGMHYVWIMSLIFYRYTFFPLAPADLSPPYWINMGAMAISTLCGALLILDAPDAPFLASLLPFIKGGTIFFWAAGTWWIPMLLVLGVWRYIYRRFALKYDPLYWGAVFPIGMYAAATFEMSAAFRIEFLQSVPPFFFYVALIAWGIAFSAFAWHLVGRFVGRP